MDIFFDLDGTLLDVSERHYSVYCDILRGWDRPPLPFARYWALKRAGAPLSDILAESGAADLTEPFRQVWLERIERRDYLEMDTVVAHGREVLHRLGGDHRLVLVTLRQSPEGLARQLRALSLEDVFRVVLTAGHSSADYSVKARLIESYESAPAGWLVGDTEVDVQAAGAVGLQSCAVTWGLRSRDFLRAVGPEALVDDVKAILDVVIASPLHG